MSYWLFFNCGSMQQKGILAGIMNIIADTHTHTIMSGHAHSTVLENLREGAKKGLRFLCVTDHTGVMPGAPDPVYFACLWSTLPREFEGVYVIRGCEANILDENGTLDISDAHLKSLQWNIASIHGVGMAPINYEAHTKLWLNIAKNPLIDVIGHCGSQEYEFDKKTVIQAFAEHGKIVEINASSALTRPTSQKNCAEIAALCVEYGVPMVVSSDAHFASEVGNVEAAVKLLERAGIGEEYVLNSDFDRFAEYLSKRTGHTFKK